MSEGTSFSSWERVPRFQVYQLLIFCMLSHIQYTHASLHGHASTHRDTQDTELRAHTYKMMRKLIHTDTCAQTLRRYRDNYAQHRHVCTRAYRDRHALMCATHRDKTQKHAQNHTRVHTYPVHIRTYPYLSTCRQQHVRMHTCTQEGHICTQRGTPTVSPGAQPRPSWLTRPPRQVTPSS